jgi:hypothetical protein
MLLCWSSFPSRKYYYIYLAAHANVAILDFLFSLIQNVLSIHWFISKRYPAMPFLPSTPPPVNKANLISALL